MTKLSELWPCFQGVIPSAVATSDGRRVPNITFISQVHLIDDEHVALSCQFFNKTRHNLAENPRACVEVIDPRTFEAWRLRLRFLRSETKGPLFDSMALRIQAIASHTGMTGVFRLTAADVFRLEQLEKVEGFLSAPVGDVTQPLSAEGFRSEVRGLHYISENINRADDVESLLDAVLESLDTYYGFQHTMVLLFHEQTQRLVTMASRGYGRNGLGAEVAIGDGLIGTVARERRLLRISGLDSELRYGRTIRRESGASTAEIPLPGLPDPQSALILPLTICDRLIGVIAAEDRDPLRFSEWHEAYLGVVANQIALGIERMLHRAAGDDAQAARPVETAGPAAAPVTSARATLTYYSNDDCVFFNGEYLIRNVPGRILWKVLREWKCNGRTEFSNRELRLDPSLGLPPVKDNLESRLLLLRRRLDEKCPDVRIVPTARGRFTVQVAGGVELVEK